MLRSNPPEEKKSSAPQTPPPPIQILDAEAFEERYEAGEIELVDSFSSHAKPATTPTPTTTPPTVKPAKKAISLKEKIYILTSSVIPAIGFGLGNTIAVLLKFVAPVAVVGGAGLTISTGLMIGLTGGFGLFALGLVAMMYHSSTKQAIEKIEQFNSQLQRLQEGIEKRAAQILNDFNNAFAMLLEMKLALEQLKRRREALDPDSFPSATEITIQRRINSYINFLVQHQDHPNFQKIDEKFRDEAIAGARQRQINIRIRLSEACDEILNDPTVHPKDFGQQAKAYALKLREDKTFRDDCFPSLHLIAPKAKRPPFINISLKEFLTSFFGAFGGIFGLPFLTIGLIGTFSVIPMAFPPLYPILALGIAYGLYNVYRVNDTKKLDAERNAEKLNKQKHLAYYYDSHKLLKDRLTTELEQYIEYQPDVIASQFSPKPQPSPEFKRQPGTTLLPNGAVDYLPSSNQKLTTSLAGEDLRFNALSQLIGPTSNPVQQPLAEPAPSSEETKNETPSITTPGLSIFSSSSSRNLSFSSSNQNLIGMEKLRKKEDLRFNAASQLTELTPNTQTASA